MQAVDFLRFLWSPGVLARYSIGTQPFGHDNSAHRRKRFDTVEAAANYALSRRNMDVWHSCAVFRHDAARSDKASILGNRNFYLDLDVKPGAYATRDDAARAAVGFVQATGLPAFNAGVGSGGGLHVYWVTDTLLTPAQWQPLGTALRALAIHHGLHLDTNVPGDMARILRTPGTFNGKDPAAPRPVDLLFCSGQYIPLGAMQAALQVAAPATAAGIFARPVPGQLSDLEQGLYDERPRSMEGIIRQCPVMQQMCLQGGNYGGYALWRDMLSLAAHVADGHKFIEGLSHKHPTFTPDILQKHWDDALARRKSGQMGPSTCATIAASSGGQLCANCAHNGVIKSPIRLANLIVAAQPPPVAGLMPANTSGPVLFPVPPSPYRLDGNAYHAMLTTKDGKSYEAPILLGRISQISRQTDNEGKYVLRLRYHSQSTDLNGNTVQVPLATLHSKSEGSQLRGLGLAVSTGRHREAVEMLMSWSNQLALSSQGSVNAQHYGWVNHAGKHVFVLGDKVYHPDGSTSVNLVPNDDGGNFIAQGSPLAWQSIAQQCHDAFSTPLQAVLAAAFASPLVALSSLPGARVLSVYGRESGSGKTTASRVAQSIWGHPDYARIKSTATYNAVPKLAGRYHSLPLVWDDLRSMVTSHNDLTNLLFQLVEGAEKRRFTDNHQPASWQCMSIITGNQSLRSRARGVQDDEHLGDVEGPQLARIFELGVPPVEPHKLTQLDGNLLLHNFGHGGAAFIAYVVANQKATADLVKSYEDYISRQVSDLTYRFHVSQIACIITAAAISTHLKLIHFDVPGLLTYLMQNLSHMVNFDTTATGQPTGALSKSDADFAYSLLTGFLNYFANRTLVTAKTQVAGAAPMIHTPVTPKIGNKTDGFPLAIVHVIMDQGEIVIDTWAMRVFCKGRGQDERVVRNLFAREFGAKIERRRPGHGTVQFQAPRQQCVVIPLSHPELSQWANGIAGAAPGLGMSVGGTP